MSGEKPNPAKIGPLGVFVEFSFIRFGWRKKPHCFSLFVLPVRRCSSCAVVTFAARSIALKFAGKLHKDARDRGAMHATSAPKKGALIIVTDRGHIVIVEEHIAQA